MASLKGPIRGWGYNDCVKEREESNGHSYYPRFLRIWSGGAKRLWVAQMVDDELFWIVDGAGPVYQEPKLFGPYPTAEDALAAAEMLDNIT
jgi:hypothetical protein